TKAPAGPRPVKGESQTMPRWRALRRGGSRHERQGPAFRARPSNRAGLAKSRPCALRRAIPLVRGTEREREYGQTPPPDPRLVVIGYCLRNLRRCPGRPSEARETRDPVNNRYETAMRVLAQRVHIGGSAVLACAGTTAQGCAATRFFEPKNRSDFNGT